MAGREWWKNLSCHRLPGVAAVGPRATGEGYWMVNARDARIIDVNDNFCEMVGYTREELLCMRISDLEVIESPEETAAHIRKIMETGHDLFETRHRHKDGRILEFEVSVSYADIRGGIIFVFVWDIGERKRQEAELKLSARWSIRVRRPLW